MTEYMPFEWVAMHKFPSFPGDGTPEQMIQWFKDFRELLRTLLP